MPPKVRDYKREYALSKKRGEQDGRVERNKARRELSRAGLVHKGDGKDIDHKRPISKGGSNARSNLRVVSAHTNRSFARNSKGGMK